METNKNSLYEKTIEEAQKLFDELLPLSGWNLENKSGDIEVYTKVDAASGLKMARGEGIISKPIIKVEEALNTDEQVLKWDDSIDTNVRVEESGDYSVTRSLDKKKMFVTQRETVLLSKTIKQEDGSVIFLGRSIDHPSVPENKNYVRALIYLWAWKLTSDQNDANKTKAIYMMFLDPKGKVPTTVFNAFVKEQANNISKIKKFVESQ